MVAEDKNLNDEEIAKSFRLIRYWAKVCAKNHPAVVDGILEELEKIDRFLGNLKNTK